MSSVLPSSFSPANAPIRQPILHNRRVAPSMPAATAPAGTFAPGTKVQVGGHRVIIEKYLSEGGFAHVYLVRLPKPIDGAGMAVLKRVAVPDKETLMGMRTEVETMKKLQGHQYIVKYMDSHVSQLKGGGYEVFLLMEYCNGGGLIDFMNTRLQNRLTEPEILQIFGDVALGVACMHYLRPPLLHRDLKVENVLISSSGSTKQFKLCDFGSAASPRPAAANAAEGRLIEEDVQKHTTMQYRSPEMIDVYRKQPIDEKSDIWALGVLLYKLCYYTTPFEEQGQMAILNASFKYPAYPPFSDRLKKLIAMMLQERPSARPNVYQVTREVCSMRGVDVPLKDIYSSRTASEARRNQQLPDPHATASPPPVIGAQKASTVEQKAKIPHVTPMRRGRPTNLAGDRTQAAPSPSPARVVATDPFAALDSSSPAVAVASFDDASQRFPSLDQFSLLHDSGGKFAFESGQTRPSDGSDQPPSNTTEALADEAFAAAPLPGTTPLTHTKSLPSHARRSNAGTQTSANSNRVTSARSVMVSTGTMTATALSPREDAREVPPRAPPRLMPSELRSSSQPRPAPGAQAEIFEARQPSMARPSLSEHRSRSHIGSLSPSKASASSRPSFESERPTNTELEDAELSLAQSRARGRPASSHLQTATRLLHGGSPSQGRVPETAPGVRHVTETEVDKGHEATQINSNVEFLKAMEGEDALDKKKEKRSSSGSKHGKRSSLPTISLSGTKSILAGRFGEAFRRFETNSAENEHGIIGDNDHLSPENLTPIAGSEATDGRSDDGHAEREMDVDSPEARRELERRRLSEEEHRVAEAAAAYKQRLAAGTGSPRPRSENTRASIIQNTVQSLLAESSRPSPTKTAEGYGRYTGTPRVIDSPGRSPQPGPSGLQAQQRLTGLPPPRAESSPALASTGAAAPERAFARPSAPPKPQALRTGGGRLEGPSPRVAPATMAKPNLEQVAAPSHGAGQAGAGLVSPEEWEASFSKRYPSLSGLEMVETEIDRSSPSTSLVRNS